jgi:hypothetical protein
MKKTGYYLHTYSINQYKKQIDKAWTDKTQKPDPEKFKDYWLYKKAEKAWNDYQTFLTEHKTGTTRGLSGTAAAKLDRADEIFVPNFKFQFATNSLSFKGNTNDSRYGTWEVLPKGEDGKRISAAQYIKDSPPKFHSKVELDKLYPPMKLTAPDGSEHTLYNNSENYYKYVSHTLKDDQGAYLPDPEKRKLFKVEKINPLGTSQKEQQAKEEKNNNTNGLTIKKNGNNTNGLKIQPANSKVPNQLISSKNNETLVASSGPLVSITGQPYGGNKKLTKKEGDPLVPEMPAVWARGQGRDLKTVNKETAEYLKGQGWDLSSFRGSSHDDLMRDFRLGRAIVYDRPDGQYLHYNNQVIYNSKKPSTGELTNTVKANENVAINQINKSAQLISSTKNYPISSPKGDIDSVEYV